MKFLANLNIKQKIAFLTVAGVILGISVFSFLGMRAVNQATEAMLQDRMTTTQLVAAYLDEILGSVLIELQYTAQLIGNSGEDADVQSYIEHLEETYSRLSISVHYFYLLNETGQIIWTKPDNPELTGVNMSYYPILSERLKEAEYDISSLVLAPITDVPVVLLMSPIQNRQEEGMGMLIVAINLIQSNIGGFIKPIRLGQTGYVEIIDQNGVVVVRTDPGPKLVPFEKSDHSGRFAELIAAGEPTRGLCHTCHEPIQKVERRDILAFVPLLETNWGVVIRQSEEEALAPINELRRDLILYGAVLAAVALTFVVVITRDVISRINMLTAASQRIAHGDLAHSIVVSGKDEVGILAETLEDMRIKLRSSYEELEKRSNELSSLLSVSEILSHLPDLSDLDSALGNALTKTLEIMGEKHGSICLLDEDRKRLSCRAQRNLYKERDSQVSYRLGEGISGRVAKTGEAILVEDISKDARLFHPSLRAMEELKGFASVPLRSKEKILGVLNIASHEVRKFSSADVQLLEGIARVIAAAVENATLHHEVRNKEKIRGELLQDIFSIQEEERKRIARELHDETSQVLSSLNASLEAAASRLTADADSDIKPILRKAQTLSINMLDEIHRLIYELRPSLLDDMGLVAATRWLVDNKLEPAGVRAELKTSGLSRRLPSRIETTLFRVIQEAVSNTIKHAHAKATNISLYFRRNVIRVSIRDDGVGFDVNEAISSLERPRGLGLLGMKERISLINGTLEIRSHPGRGTEIDIAIPLNKEVSDG